MRFRVLALFLICIGAAACAVPVAAHANLVRAEPAVGASVPTAPASVRLYFSEAPEPRYSEISIFSATLQRFDHQDLHLEAGDNTSLVVGVRDMPQGVYTVVWRTTSAMDGHTTDGSFAFGVGAATVTGGATAQNVVTFSRPSPLEVATKWLAYLGISCYIGALILALFVWAPAISASEPPAADRALAERVNGRLRLVAATGAVILAAATGVGALAQVAKATGASLIGALDLGALHGYLLGTRAGEVWTARFIPALILAVVLCTPLEKTVLARWPRAARLRGLAPQFGLGVGAVEVLTICLISHAAATAFNKPATIAFDWLHLIAAAVWIGGMVSLAATVPLIPTRRDQQQPMLRGVEARFSVLAIGSVSLLAVSGAFLAWVHIGSLSALRMTDYGRTLMIKLAVIAGLLPLGAINLLWVRPRLAIVQKKASAAAKETARTAKHFRHAVQGEVALAAAVLLVVAVLTGLAPARSVIGQTAGSSLARSARADDLSLTLTPSSLQPGETTYDVLVTKGVPVTDAERVAMRFSSRDLGIAETEAIATTQGNGHYVVTGAYTAVQGTWQTRVIVRRIGRDDANATFDLPIGTAPDAATRANAAPALSGAVVAYGSLAVAAVLAALAGFALLSRRLVRDPSGPMSGLAYRALAAALVVAYLIGAVGLYRGFSGPVVASDTGTPSSSKYEVHMAMVAPGILPDPNAPHVFVGGTKTIRAGTTITFINDDIHPHDVVSGRYGATTGTVAPHTDAGTAPHVHSGGIAYPDNRFSSAVLEPGQRWQFAFKTPGVYPYICTLHPGMAAVITVT